MHNQYQSLPPPEQVMSSNQAEHMPRGEKYCAGLGAIAGVAVGGTLGWLYAIPTPIVPAVCFGAAGGAIGFGLCVCGQVCCKPYCYSQRG